MLARWAASLLWIGFVALAPAGAVAPPPAQGELPAGEGRDLVLGYCTACHTTEMITAAHMSRKSWDDTLVWMQETQGLGEIPSEDRDAILDYLAEVLGIEDLEEGDSPWAEPLYRPNPIWPMRPK